MNISLDNGSHYDRKAKSFITGIGEDGIKQITTALSKGSCSLRDGEILKVFVTVPATLLGEKGILFFIN